MRFSRPGASPQRSAPCSRPDRRPGRRPWRPRLRMPRESAARRSVRHGRHRLAVTVRAQAKGRGPPRTATSAHAARASAVADTRRMRPPLACPWRRVQRPRVASRRTCSGSSVSSSAARMPVPARTCRARAALRSWRLTSVIRARTSSAVYPPPRRQDYAPRATATAPSPRADQPRDTIPARPCDAQSSSNDAHTWRPCAASSPRRSLIVTHKPPNTAGAGAAQNVRAASVP